MTSDVICLVVPGNPPLKGFKHRISMRGGYPHRYNAPEYKAFIKSLTRIADDAGILRIESGLWHCTVAAYWGRLRHLDHSVPFGDIDAPVESVLDALQAAHVLDDDARVIELVAQKHHAPDNPRVEVTLRRLR